MIPSTEVNHATAGRHTASLQMGIDPAAFQHIIGILTDLYSDKPKAVIREYSTNGHDSNVLAGQARPIEVSLPVNGSRTPVFRVQDFGVGLSFDELRDVYAQYGASTKRNSNDVNGMLGLGCKSALTYAPSFTITSVKDGRKVMAVISKDSEGVGAIKVLADLPITEPNGVTVEIPVPANSVGQFREKALSFYRFWEPGTVLIDGKDPSTDPDHGGTFFQRQTTDGDTAVWITPDILVTRTNSYSEKSYIIMGNVAYPHDFATAGCTIRAWVPIGDVDFVPSREALHYTEKTNATVKRIKATFASLLQKRIEEVAGGGTVFEKNNVLYSWGQSIPSIMGLRPKVSTDPKLTFKVSHDYATRHKHPQIDWRLIQNSQMNLVSGFPFKSVGPSHKHRLKEFFPNGQSLLFPPSADLSAIEGHPRLVSWEQVVKATNKPAPQKRQGTVYTAKKIGQPDQTALNFGTGATVYYTTQGCNSRAAEVWQVNLKMSQVERFKKLHPLSKTVESYINEKHKAAEAALTDDDRLAAAVQRGHFSGPLLDVNWQKAVSSGLVDDPLLKRVTGLASYSSPTLTEAINLGVTIPGPPTLIQEISDRYPLLEEFSSCTVGSYYNRKNVTGELVTYVNAKYSQLNGKKP